MYFYFDNNKSIFENGLVVDVQKWDSQHPITISNEEDKDKANKLIFEGHINKKNLTEASLESFEDIRHKAEQYKIIAWKTTGETLLREKVSAYEARMLEKEAEAKMKAEAKA